MEDIPGRHSETGLEHQPDPDTEEGQADCQLHQAPRQTSAANGNEHEGEHANNGATASNEKEPMVDFTVTDAAGKPWTLSDYHDAAAVVTFHRGDF